MSFNPQGLATAIGSLPHPGPEAACRIILESIPEIPIWPQLSRRGLREQMEIQYSEGLPRAVLDTERDRLYFDTSGDYYDELAEFYAGYMAAEEDGDCSMAAISPEYAVGIPALEARLKTRGSRLPLMKCQTTGPDFLRFDDRRREQALHLLQRRVRRCGGQGPAMKCRWQVQKFKPYADDVICFIDEPILSAFGSSTYVSVQRDDVVARLSEVIEAIHAENAWPASIAAAIRNGRSSSTRVRTSSASMPSIMGRPSLIIQVQSRIILRGGGVLASGNHPDLGQDK